MIVATAGHVDHGKTALIKALTGQQTDRTAEEQRRGMSIELGYAFLQPPSGRPVDFVDVPGHGKFMRTLLAGVACVDALLLVVAADDGVMPQTLEHLALIGLLGIRQVIVVISKTTLAAPGQINALEQDLRERVQAQGCSDPVCFGVDSVTGAGIDALRTHLLQTAAATREHAGDQPARMVIDRYFSQPGLGPVVTGTVIGGAIAVGNFLQLSDSGETVRVRGIQIHHSDAQRAQAGQRCALNLSGDLSAAAPGRGSQLLAQGRWSPTDRFDAHMQLSVSRLPGRVQLHIGSATINARLVPLKGFTSARGSYGQWILEQPICCFQGDRFLVRDPAARQLLGSGRVVDPYAPQRGRQHPQRLAVLQALEQPVLSRCLEQLLDASPDGIDVQQFILCRQIEQLPVLGDDMLNTGHWLFRHSRLRALAQRAVQCVAEQHRQHPQRLGPTRPQLARMLDRAADSRLLALALRNCLDNNLLRQTGACLHLPDHSPAPDPELQGVFQQVEPLFLACSPRPPVIGELTEQLSIDKTSLLQALDRLCTAGLLVFVSRNRYLLPGAADQLLKVARGLAAADQHGSFSTADFRDQSGIGRNHSVAVLEYFDRHRLTRQQQGLRVMI